eukprot:scaffold437_cov168-Ochromonas_danica.AAC.23
MVLVQYLLFDAFCLLEMRCLLVPLIAVANVLRREMLPVVCCCRQEFLSMRTVSGSSGDV